ncbi:MAG: FAD-dependent oxidoreductase [Microbacteriaceae bacterium]|nr:FAD-dependent oxidoreductase [Microbacteriaceae bacterium]
MSWWQSAPLLDTVDVVVAGSGSAGSSAAISAARGGARTLLIEKLPFLGGNSTAVLDTFYGFYTPGDAPRKIVGGVGDDVVTRLRELGPVIERPNTYGAGTGVTYNAEHLKVAWESLAAGAGVRVLLHCFVQDVAVRDGRLEQLLIATKAGLRRIRTSVVIDTTGDADVVAFAGWGFEQAGTEAPAQTLTTTFRVVNVDLTERRTVGKDRLHELMRGAHADGYALPRREGSDHITPVDGMTATVMTRLDSTRRGDDGAITSTSDPLFLSEAEQAGRRQALEYVRFLVDRVPGYANASLGALSTQIGVRETRRVYGDYRLTRDDVLSARSFDDQIGLCGAPIEDHHGGDGTVWEYLPSGSAVGIPLRSLLVRDASNALTAGRSFSATHDAHASVRSMAQCMAMGQAAGATAALAVQHGTDPRNVPAREVQDRLRTDGAILEVAA